MTGASGGIDPDISLQSLVDRYSSKGIYTCCKDKTLDQLIAKSAQTVGTKARQTAFDSVYAYIAKKVYVVPLYALGVSVVSSKKLDNVKAGPGVSNITPYIDLTNVSMG